MHATLIRSGRGFWGRSIDELSRLTQIVLTSEAIKGPSGPKQLASFTNPDCLEDLKLITDAEIGGFSKAGLEWITPSFPSNHAPTPSTSNSLDTSKPSKSSDSTDRKSVV